MSKGAIGMIKTSAVDRRRKKAYGLRETFIFVRAVQSRGVAREQYQAEAAGRNVQTEVLKLRCIYIHRKNGAIWANILLTRQTTGITRKKKIIPVYLLISL